MTAGHPSPATIRHFSAAEVTALLPPAAAVAAVEAALRNGLDPATGVPRSSVPLAHGSLLLMPAETTAHVGVKLATVAPGNPGRGLPRINALYVVFDAATLQPAALIDGTALTILRTPAVSFAAVRRFLPEAPNVVIFGAGPQATGHLATLEALTTPSSVTIVTRTGAQPGRPDIATGQASAAETRSAAQPGRPRAEQASAAETRSAAATNRTRVVRTRAGTPETEAALRAADLVVCATTAREPLFDSALLGERTVMVAVGSHEPDAREVDAAFCARATVIVEDRATALRECGDIIQAVAEGALTEDRLHPMADLPAADGPVLFKGSGMSWQDLVIAEALLHRAARPS